jgi:integrase
MGRFETMTLVMGYCGLRYGEVTALRRKAVDGKTITVSASVDKDRLKGWVETATKTDETRWVAVPEFVWERLERELPTDPDALVFPSRSGGYLPNGEYRWAFNKAASTVGVAGLVPHELRHTAASLAIEAYPDPKAIQNLLGHKTFQMTMDRYGHLLTGNVTKVAEALNKAALVAAADSGEG